MAQRNLTNKRSNYQTGETRYEGGFRSSAQSLAFNPETAIDTSKQEEQRLKEIERDSATKAQALRTQQGLDSGMLKGRQQAERAQQSFTQAGEKGKLALIKGLTDLSSTAAKTVADWSEKKAAEDEAQNQLDQATSWLENAGTVLGPNDDGGVSPVDNPDALTAGSKVAEAQTADINNQVAAIETGVVDATQDPELQERLRADSADEQAIQNVAQGNVFVASTNIGAALGDFLDSDTQVRLPDGTIVSANAASSREELTAIARAYVKSYVAANGLVTSGSAQKAFVRTFLPAAMNAVSQQVSQRSAGIRDAKQNARVDVANTTAFQSLRAGGSVADAWTTLSTSYFGSGKYKGDRTKANEAAINALLDYLVQTGDETAIEQLENTPKFTTPDGHPGPKLGTTYAAKLAKAKRDARRTKAGDRRLADDEAKETLEDANNSFLNSLIDAKTPQEVEAAHEAYEATLKSLGTPEATTEWLKQRSIPNNRNPLAYGDMLDRATTDGLSNTEINEAVGSGLISIQQGNELKQINGAGLEAENAALKPVQPTVKAITAAAANAALVGAKVPPEALRPASVAISADLTTRLNSYLSGLLKADPSMSTGQLTEAAQNWTNSNSQRLLSTIEWNPDTYSVQGYNYVGVQSTSSATANTFTNPATGKKAVVLTGLSVEQMSSLQFDDNIKNDIDVSNDRVLKSDEMASSLQAIMAGDLDAIPARVRSIAKLLEVTPQYLIAQQAKAQGLPNASEISRQVTYDPNRNNFGANGPSNMEEGVSYFRQQGFSAKGAAMLSANIQSESSWNGSRDWGAVAGDGTSRNGGLVSWAQWSDDPARLGAAEAFIGKPISQSTHAEQLEFMLHEMKTSYSDVWRIMRNPNATDAQLRRAAKAYWGYGIEGDRFRFYNNLAYG